MIWNLSLRQLMAVFLIRIFNPFLDSSHLRPVDLNEHRHLQFGIPEHPLTNIVHRTLSSLFRVEFNNDDPLGPQVISYFLNVIDAH